jgi:tyrosyl-tRNA synthetase
VTIKADELAAGLMVADLFVRLELTKSKNEARRLIKGGGARLDGESIKEETMVLTAEHFASKAEVMLSAGKKKHGMVELASA